MNRMQIDYLKRFFVTVKKKKDYLYCQKVVIHMTHAWWQVVTGQGKAELKAGK